MIQIKLNPAQLKAKLALIQAQLGEALAPNAGTLSHAGVTVDYHYDGATTLAIDVTHKPFFLTQTEVESKILAWFAGS